MGWRFDPGEALRDAFLRVAAEEIAKVRSLLSDPSIDRAKAVHEARQGFKRLRALLRLAQPSLGFRFDDENRFWRDAGRQLAGARDRTVLLESFDKIAEGCGPKAQKRQLARLRRHLAADGGRREAQSVEACICGVVALLEDVERRIESLDWPADVKELAKGLRRGQSRLRKDWKAARKEPQPEALHDWRKRVKDQAAQMRLFRQVAPEPLRARHGDEKKVAELLGEEHDFWMLAERLQGDGLPPETLPAREAMLDEASARRRALRKEAFRLGDAFSVQKGKSFARDLTDAWKNASPRSNGRKNGKATSRAS
jgi:CHAD domain-containing protein